MQGSRRRRQHGVVALELAIVTPVMLLLLLVVAQYAMWELGREMAQGAAQRAADAARLQGGTDSAGVSAGQAAIAAQGPHLVVGPQVAVTRTATTVHVDVRGTAEGVVPFLMLPIDAVADSPVEQATAGP